MDQGPTSRVVYSWLVLYFACNLGLTIYNKIIMQFVDFHYPFMVTALHSFFSAVGSYIVVSFQGKKELNPEIYTLRGVTILFSFSLLYTINIAVSNVSLNLVNIAFHQLVRSTTPVFTVFISLAFGLKIFSRDIYISLIPVVMGVALSTYGDLSFTRMGFILTILGTALAAIKTIVTNLVLVGGLKLEPLELIWRMSFLAFFQCLFYAYISGEWDEMVANTGDMSLSVKLILAGNGFVAFLLNYVSFTANKYSSALTMTVAANVKQVLTIILAFLIFDLKITFINGLGIIIAILGGVQYTAVEYREKEEEKKMKIPRVSSV